MATAVVKATHDFDALSVDLLRQKVIVHLLREISWEPEMIANYVKELIQKKILAQEVCDDVRKLFLDKGLAKVNAKAGSCEGNNAMVNPQPIARAQVDAATPTKGGSPSSRFEQEFDRLELLGRGGFGEVWRARSRVDHKEYAIKKVQYRFDSKDGPFKHPALREAQAWADFEHPNAVRYHASWVEVDEDVTELEPTRVEDKPMLVPQPVARDDFSTEDSEGSSASSAFLDESSGGVVFEASKSDDADKDGGAAQQEVQIVPRAPAESVSRQRATLYLQTEFVRGGTLLQWIDERNTALKGVDVDDAKRQASSKAAEDIFRQTVDAVATLHAQGLVHRDIKPANILLTEAGGVRLGDFGLAKDAKKTAAAKPALEDAANHVLQLPESADSLHTVGVGTPTYASPEQMRDMNYGFEVDIYALGMVLAELLVPVHTQMERAQLFEGLRQGRLPLGADALSPGAADVVLKMISVDPKERPTAHELAALLHQRALQQTTPVVYNQN
eukprot:TRINITY_DN6553_c2_g2_i1.p1 TRINITY_DN6553_c2_g2~~TRINITY_DN6553_c2_g2_i1.p1  ORF type:complete len:502 (-),score=86.08 TRINITY_DN6553_c2_g2_i1:564-2069(-)